jgi:hypothetical protein
MLIDVLRYCESTGVDNTQVEWLARIPVRAGKGLERCVAVPRDGQHGGELVQKEADFHARHDQDV